MSEKSYISAITLPSNSTYYIKDEDLTQRVSTLESYTDYLGVTTTALTDGSTINPITINNKSVTAVVGNIVNYNPQTGTSKEFIFNGSIWQEFGDLSALGSLAYKSAATAGYTPSGSVIVQTGDTIGKWTVVYPLSVNSTTPSNQKYTPAGTVSTPTINVATAGSTTTINNPTKATVVTGVSSAAPGATAPANAITYYSVNNEVLSLYQLGYNTGDSITTSTVSVKTGDASYNSSTIGFTGEQKRFETGPIAVPDTYIAGFTGTASTITVH